MARSTGGPYRDWNHGRALAGRRAESAGMVYAFRPPQVSPVR